MIRFPLLQIGIGLLALIACAENSPPAPEPQVTPVPAAIRERFGLAPFYQKHIAVGPLPIVGSAKVSDPALREAAWIVRHVLEGRDDLLGAMATNRTRLAVMAFSP